MLTSGRAGGPPWVRSVPRLLLGGDALDYAEKLNRELGDVVDAGHLGKRPVFLLTHPDAAQHVLVTNAKHYERGLGFAALSHVGPDCLSLLEGGTWLERRRLLQGTFDHAAIAPMATTIAECGARFCAGAEKKLGAVQVVNVHAWCTALTLEVIARLLFSEDADTGDGLSGLADNVRVIFDYVSDAMTKPWLPPLFVPTAQNRKFKAATATLRAHLSRVVRGRAGKTQAGGPQRDMLDFLLAARFTDGTGLTEAQIIDEVVQFFVAGHETTALGLSWSLALLAREPRHIEAIRQHQGIRQEGRPYAEAVFSETLRLYPPSWIFVRAPLQDDRIGDVALPKGAVILISPWVIHRRPDLWPEPERFRPERFIGDATRRAGAYLAFGAGARLCIGKALAMLEGPLLLEALLAHFDFAPVGGAIPKPRISFTLLPSEPLLLQITPRAAGH